MEGRQSPRAGRQGRRSSPEVLLFGTSAMAVAAVAFFLILQPSAPWLETILELMALGGIVGAGTGVLLRRWRDRAVVGFLNAFLGVTIAIYVARLILATVQPGEYLWILGVLLALLFGIPAGLAGVAGAFLAGLAAFRPRRDVECAL